MTKVNLYIVDSSNVDLSNINNITGDELLELEKYKVEETKKEKAVSLSLKKLYIEDWYVDEYGKPLADDVFFNVSHSHGMVVLAMNDDYPIGVDIEKIRPVEEKFKKYISNKEEVDYIDGDEKFFEIWTSKESLLKAVGLGISMRMENVPALPINGKKQFKEEAYFSKSVRYLDYIISVTLKSDSDFELTINQ